MRFSAIRRRPCLVNLLPVRHPLATASQTFADLRTVANVGEAVAVASSLLCISSLTREIHRKGKEVFRLGLLAAVSGHTLRLRED